MCQDEGILYCSSGQQGQIGGDDQLRVDRRAIDNPHGPLATTQIGVCGEETP